MNRDDWQDVLEDWIGSREYAVELLRKARGWEQCNDGEFTYYATVVGNQRLMYRKTYGRTDGRKMYKLTEPLARMMGFDSFDSMRYLITTIQYWRGWVSPQRLKVALVKYISVMNRCRY